MKILQVNKFLHVVGGASRYFIELTDLLEKKGHNVAVFSMGHKKNSQSYWDKYFINNISLEKINSRNAIRAIGRMIYSLEAVRKLEDLLKEFTPDIIHLHSLYHYISPSIISLIHQRNIPVVQSLGDYHIISPNYHLFHNGRICEITKKNKFYRAFFHKCVKNSFLGSLIEVIEKYIHFYFGWERKYVDYFVVPSKFIKTKFFDYGLTEEKIIHLPYFIDYIEYQQNYNNGSYILYFGRLSPEKGLNNLLDVMKILPAVKLRIAGRGPEEERLKYLAKSLKLINVEFLGFKEERELKQLIANSRFTILPSVWYEVFGLSILESFACGKPIIASRIGGIPETVRDGFNGFLVEPGNIDDLADKIDKLWNNPALCKKLGKNAREYIEKNFNPEEHYDKLMSIYKKTISLHK